MKKWERLFREILHSFYTRGERFFIQKQLCSVCSISPGAASRFLAWLEQIGAVEHRPQGFRLLDPGKILLSWAVKRNLMEDVVYSTKVPSLSEAEKSLSGKVLFTAHSGYKLTFGENPGYDRIMAYGKVEEVREVVGPAEGQPNLLILKWDDHLARLSEGGKVPLVQLYVDLWQLGATKLLGRIELELEKSRLSALEKLMVPPAPEGSPDQTKP
ncbi:MAG: hypothetical protein QXH26_00020 [Candidatus Hadarchaeales archaeon]